MPRCSPNLQTRVKVPLLANMTEFGGTPSSPCAEFEKMGYRIVIWPVSSLRVANKAQEELYAAINRDDGTHKQVLERMQTRKELYATYQLPGVRGARRLDRQRP